MFRNSSAAGLHRHRKQPIAHWLEHFHCRGELHRRSREAASHFAWDVCGPHGNRRRPATRFHHLRPVVARASRTYRKDILDHRRCTSPEVGFYRRPILPILPIAHIPIHTGREITLIANVRLNLAVTEALAQNSCSIQEKMEMKTLSKAARAAMIGILCGTLTISTVTLGGCNATQAEADIQKVIALLPTAVQIAGSILNIVAAAEGPAGPRAELVATVKASSGQVQSDLTLANSLVAQYQTDLASAPAGVIGQIDAAVADAQQNVTAILGAVHVANPTIVAAVNSAVASIQTVILALIAILPVAVAAASFPKLGAQLKVSGGQPGAAKPGLASPRAFAKAFNQDAHVAAIQRAYPKAHIMVPVPHAKLMGGPLPEPL